MSLDSSVSDEMQTELIALMKAWDDRGIKISDVGQVLLGASIVILARAGATLGQLVEVIVKDWSNHGGRT